MFPLSERMKLVSESITLKVSAKAAALKKAGVDVVGFGAGEPDFDTPAFIKEAAKQALDKGQTKYTPTPSLPELKQAIAEKFNRDNQLPYKPEQITVGAGGKHCLYMAFMAILNPGDEVLIPSPYWVSYPEQVKLAGGVNKIIPGEEKNDFKITPQQLEKAITPKSKVLVLNSPSNPGGHAYEPAELKALADVVVKHPNLVVLRTFSKAMAMAGLRFGYLMAHPEIAREIYKAKLPYNVNIFTLAAADIVVEKRAVLREAISKLVQERERVTGELQRRPAVRVFPSKANFVLIRTPKPARDLFDALYKQGVLVRDVSAYPLLERCLRVSIGLPEENDRFIKALDRVLENTP